MSLNNFYYPNYNVDFNGIIYQIEKKPFTYNEKYVSIYDELDSRSMSILRYNHIVDMLKIKPISILDIGYGNGDLLKYCQSQYINSFGYDISNVSVPDHCYQLDYLNHDDKTEYEIITFYDSLEHFPDIYSAIKNLPQNHLYVVVSLPWCQRVDSIDIDWFKNWSHRKVDEHLWYFSDVALVNFMSNNGYRTISISNTEDQIRQSNINKPNILTGIFKKI